MIKWPNDLLVTSSMKKLAGILVEMVADRQSRRPDPKLGGRITARCLELGLSMNIVSLPGLASVWRIAPPLTATAAEIVRGLAILDQAIRDCR